MKQHAASPIGLLLLAAGCCLHSPAQGADVKQAVIEAPFELIHDSIVIQVTVNGRGPFSMLLDTGADPSVIDLAAAKNVGLKLAAQGQQGSGGGAGATLAYETVLPAVRIGGLTATNIDALGMDLSKLSSALGRPIGGVLGYSLLRARIVQIDFSSLKVRFYTVSPSCPTGPDSPLPKCTTLRFRYQDDILATGVTVNGKRVITNIDTGSNSYFQITPAAINKLGLSADLARAHTSSSVGFNGELTNREGTVRNVTVGTLSVNNPTVVFFGKGMGMEQEAWDLRIGNKFLKHYLVTLDFQHGLITLAERARSEFRTRSASCHLADEGDTAVPVPCSDHLAQTADTWQRSFGLDQRSTNKRKSSLE